MALISCELFSESLMRATTITVILPQATEQQIGLIDQPLDGPPPVLYLLHGLSDDHTAWQRYTSVERYAVARGLAVVMPAVDRSFYANEAQGHRYWDWVSEELPRLVGQFFNVSQTPEDTFVAGLSMGGYGALKHAFTHPERYAAVATLSGVARIQALGDDLPRPEVVQRVFGGEITPADDVLALLEAAKGPLPKLYVGCGNGEELLLPQNQALVAAAEAKGMDVTVDFRPGTHEWTLWDAQIQDVIRWLPVRID
ncbi:MAG TPA: alpha/beta hydrolase family protein [Nocardioides sp.]|uniref:alpha/beta hydrolase n=1 Tax=Nocardioides sp. TaxID=35761 RepID=UPI002E318693|nr:alpha/beta hydrolase family protein [Nocardioides sp.]HEX5089990.1 alpha/beta hydrolase family protein [Nocardioides sp.]